MISKREVFCSSVNHHYLLKYIPVCVHITLVILLYILKRQPDPSLMFQLGNYPFLSVVLPCVLNICLRQKLLWVLFHCLSLPLFSPHTSQGANTTRLLPNALPFHSNFTTLHMMETGYSFFVIIHLLEIGMQEQSKKKQTENTVQQRKNVCLINARCLVLSVEVTLLPIQREKMLIGMVVCFPLWFLLKLVCYKDLFPVLKSHWLERG